MELKSEQDPIGLDAVEVVVAAVILSSNLRMYLQVMSSINSNWSCYLWKKPDNGSRDGSQYTSMIIHDSGWAGSITDTNRY